MADQISDAILDALLANDPKSRVAVETMLTNGVCIIAGEVTTSTYVDMAKIARNVIKEIGYDGCGFHHASSGVMTAIKEQSSDIAQGVDSFKKTSGGKIIAEDLEHLGAGDQGCIKEGSWVLTGNGYKLIENIQTGDEVITPFGLNKVKHKVCTGVKKVIELLFSDGYKLECTPDHKIMCYLKDGSNIWKEAREITEDDFVCIHKPSINSTKNHVLSEIKKEQFFTKYNHTVFGYEEVVLDEKMGYLLGLIIGDGSVTKKNHVDIAFGKNENLANKASEIIEEKVGLKSAIITGIYGDFNIRVNSILFRKHLENFGVDYLKSPQKVTPAVILQSPQAVWRSYLQGLFDTDGTIIVNTGRKKENIRIRLGSSSLKLLQETQLLLNQLGIQSSILFNAPAGKSVGRDPKYKSNYDSYVLSLKGFESYQRFCQLIGFNCVDKKKRAEDYLSQIKIKQANSRGIYLLPHPDKEEMISENKLGKELPFSVVKLKSMRDSGEAKVYDLGIEDIHIFSANGIYVHNCMFGYACDETPELMPLPIVLAHRLCQRLALVRRKNIVKGLYPDGKSQVTVEYENDKPKRVHTVLIAAQHHQDKDQSQLQSEIVEQVIKPVCLAYGCPLDKNTNIYINTTGKFVIGGPEGDTGLTGRKIIVDTYGGMAHHGGGAFSGKDPSKVDRSGAYAARWVAKSVVASKLADKCEIQISYAIGKPEPLSIFVNTFGTAKISDQEIIKLINKNFDLRPGAIIRELNLRQPIYAQIAAYGHFGRPELNLPWEKAKKLVSE